jgi:hypothetical protein
LPLRGATAKPRIATPGPGADGEDRVPAEDSFGRAELVADDTHNAEDLLPGAEMSDDPVLVGWRFVTVGVARSGSGSAVTADPEHPSTLSAAC